MPCCGETLERERHSNERLRSSLQAGKLKPISFQGIGISFPVSRSLRVENWETERRGPNLRHLIYLSASLWPSREHSSSYSVKNLDSVWTPEDICASRR